MKPIKCKYCGFPLEIVEIREFSEIYRCSTCGKQEIVDLAAETPGEASTSSDS
jgi:DNA-directed RNA polymerase subunit RPC12/RpoP